MGHAENALIPVVTYKRVSTDKQGRSGLGLDAQEAAITHFVRTIGATIVGCYEDVESGTIDDRTELIAAIEHAKNANARLVVSTLDRLSRDVHFISGLLKRGVDFVAADMPSASTFELHIRAAISEEERRKISLRTKAALAATRARGTLLGGYRGIPPSAATRAKSREKRAELSRMSADRIAPIVKELRSEGITTYRALAKALTERACPTPRGRNTWTAMQVRRIEIK